MDDASRLVNLTNEEKQLLLKRYYKLGQIAVKYFFPKEDDIDRKILLNKLDKHSSERLQKKKEKFTETKRRGLHDLRI